MRSPCTRSRKLLTATVVLGLVAVAASAAASPPDPSTRPVEGDAAVTAGSGVGGPDTLEDVRVTRGTCDHEEEDCAVEYTIHAGASPSRDQPWTSSAHAGATVESYGSCLGRTEVGVAGVSDSDAGLWSFLKSDSGNVPFYRGAC